MLVLQMSPAKSAPLPSATDLAISSARRLIGSRSLLAADHPELLAMRVVRERLDDVGARVDEVAMQLAHDFGMLEHDLGHEGAGLQIAAALELEHIALGADHRSLVEPFEQRQSWRGRSVMAIGGRTTNRPSPTIACFGEPRRGRRTMRIDQSDAFETLAGVPRQSR